MSKRGFTFIEVLVAVSLIAILGGALLFGMRDATSGQQISSAQQSAAYLFDYLSGQIARGNPRYTPPAAGSTLVLSRSDIQSAFADQTGATLANAQLLSARITNVKTVEQDIAGEQITTVEYLVKVCWHPLTKTTDSSEQETCIEKSITGPVPSRFAGSGSTPSSELVPIGAGKLTININAPSGVSGKVQVVGPSLNEVYTESIVLTDLPTGNYTITPYPVSDSLYDYLPSMTSASESIGAGEGAVVNVTYTPSTGALAVNVSTPFTSATPNIIITSSTTSYSQTVHDTTTLSYLAPGEYHISADPIHHSMFTYSPDITPADVTVSAGSTASVTVSYGPTTGALKVSATAPSEVTTATTRILGPNNYEASVGLGDSTLDNLLEGTYVAVPEDVIVSGVTYRGAADPASGAYVTAGHVSDLHVTYSPIDSSLTINVKADSTPADIDPTVHLLLPDGSEQILSGLTTHTLKGLSPGSYTINADPASDGTFTWTPSPDTKSLDLHTGDSEEVAVTYSITTAVLKLLIGGLPSDSGTPVKLITPSRTLSFGAGTHTLSAAEPGDYQIVAASVDSGYFSYSPSPATKAFTVVAGSVATERVTYEADTGAISISADGLPDSLSPTFTLTYGATSRNVPEGVVPRLQPGDYDIAAGDVSDGYATYKPSPDHKTVSVSPGLLADATFTYSLQRGILSFEVQAPADATLDITAEGPSGPYSVDHSGVTGFSNVVPGVYAITAQPTTSNNIRYVPTYPDSVEVRSGETTTVPITYDPVNAAIEVKIEGLDGLANQPTISVTGPDGYSEEIGSNQVLEVEPGDYTFTPQPLISDGERYESSPLRIHVDAGEYKFARIVYQRVTGSITVNISGLPAGTDADVSIGGSSGYSNSITSTTTLKGLEPGDYYIEARGVTANGYEYEPNTNLVHVVLSAGADANADIVYSASTGVIVINVTAPDGVSYDIEIAAGSVSYEHSGSGNSSSTITGAKPTHYDVIAPSVTYDHIVYQATADPPSFDLSAGSTQRVNVSYAASSAILDITIDGLPSGTDARVNVTGPHGYSTTVTSSTTLDSLEPGTYVISPNSVDDGSGGTYEGVATPSSVSLTAGQRKSVSVVYDVLPATLRLVVEGVPTGATPTISLTGNGVSDTVNGSHTWTSLEPGTYQLKAEPFTYGGFTYVANPNEKTVDLVSRNTTTVNMTYSATKGKVVISVNGCDDAPYTVKNNAGYQRTYTGSQEIYLTPGDYQITANDYTDSSGHVFKPVHSPVTFTATAGQETAVTFDFYRYTAGINVTATGVPSGHTASYTLKGPSGIIGSFNAPHSHVVPPGDYLIEPNDITSGEHVYRAPPISIHATSSNDYSPTISYSEYTGLLKIETSGLPSGAVPTITVSGNGISKSTSSTSASWYLPPGTYTVTGTTVTASGIEYRTDTLTVSVESGRASSYTLDYYRYTATLNVTVSSAPTTPTVTVSKPGFSTSATGTNLTFNIAPGTYTVKANRLSYRNFYYEASPVTVQLSDGQTKNVTLKYKVTTSIMRVYNKGSRSGYPSVTLNGPSGYTSSIPANSNPAYKYYLVPGTYSLSYTTPYYLSTTKRFVVTSSTSTTSVTAGHTGTLSIYWQYQEYVCTAYFLFCWSYGWVNK